jgi:hypothetical protein
MKTILLTCLCLAILACDQSPSASGSVGERRVLHTDDGYVEIYVGRKLSGFTEEELRADPPPTAFDMMRFATTYEQLALSQEHPVTLSFCDPSNDFSVTSTTANVDLLSLQLIVFRPGDEGVYGRAQLGTDASGLRAGYTINWLKHFDDGAMGLSIFVAGSVAPDEQVEDPMASSCSPEGIAP